MEVSNLSTPLCLIRADILPSLIEKLQNIEYAVDLAYVILPILRKISYNLPIPVLKAGILPPSFGYSLFEVVFLLPSSSSTS